MRFPGSFREIHQPGRRYPPLIWPRKQKINGNLEIFHHFLTWFDFFFDWVHFFECTIVTQSLLDLKTSFLRFLEVFDAILKFRLSNFPKIWNVQILLGHFKEGYLPPGWWISRKEPGNRIFRSSRCGFKKNWSKNIIFSQSYDLLDYVFFFAVNVLREPWKSLHSLAGGFIC